VGGGIVFLNYLKKRFIFRGKLIAMSEKDYQRLMDEMAEFKEEVKLWTKEEALAFLVSIGHLDKDGNFTEPYKHLATVVKSI